MKSGGDMRAKKVERPTKHSTNWGGCLCSICGVNDSPKSVEDVSKKQQTLA